MTVSSQVFLKLDGWHNSIFFFFIDLNQVLDGSRLLPLWSQRRDFGGLLFFFNVMFGYWLLYAELWTVWLLEAALKARECLCFQEYLSLYCFGHPTGCRIYLQPHRIHIWPADIRDEQIQIVQNEEIKKIMEGEWKICISLL